jgi:hypothetical protein
MTLQSFNTQLAARQLPCHAVWGGFRAEPTPGKPTPFPQRPDESELLAKAKPGDRICDLGNI